MVETFDGPNAFEHLSVGDVIRVPQYQNALEVIDEARDVGLLGVEFADDSKKTGTVKHLVQSQHTGRVGLISGAADKGTVDSVEIVSRSAGGIEA